MSIMQMQVEMYLGKSDKLIDFVCDKVYEVTCNPTLPLIEQQRDRNTIRDILVGVVHQQMGTKLIEAETLFVQANVIQDAEGDIREHQAFEKEFCEPKSREGHTGHLMEGSDIDRVTNYSRTYCAEHKCPLRDITDREEGDSDEFYCGTLDCPRRTPDNSNQDF